MRNNYVKKKVLGFTIVELAIVLSIIAILSALLIPQLVNFKQSATKQITEIGNNINQSELEETSNLKVYYYFGEILLYESDNTEIPDFITQDYTLISTELTNDSDITILKLFFNHK